ncbi:exo-alpha-sialidase [Mucilaginibacter roseus]|uniref:Exo-alpha-sialidase n=1 Tax=Mucilaginibacter roseus TaxID=1528868 RepID=A0ABS8U034_9SPHI|nr:sialidase family protein [Mucilaginibacter roseus]MCD8740466.1 exo-alpha-sialidase [Mucilaginibacter roseus]
MMKCRSLLIALMILLAPGIGRSQSFKKISTDLVFTDAPFKQCHASTIVQNNAGELLLACFGGTQEGKNDVSIWITKLSDGKASDVKIVADGVVNDTLRYPAWNPVLFKDKAGKITLFYKVGANPREWWGMYKTSTDDGKTWSAAVKLPAGILGPIKNKPIQLPNGVILSPSSIEEMGENGRWKAHIERSADNGKTWDNIPVDTAGKFDVIQPSVLTYPGGRLQILCRSKQGKVVQAWSTDGGKTWSKLSETTLLNPNSGTDAVTLKSGRQLIVYNPDVPGKDWFNGRGKLRVAKSTDGQKWTDVAELENGDKEEYSYPAIIQTKDGLIHITYTYDRKNIKHVVLRESSR